jgi:hypothetical protein
MKSFKDYFKDLSILDYEMFNLQSNFGQTMIKNFELRGIPLSSKYDYEKKNKIFNIY